MSISLGRVLISDEVDPKCVEILEANGIHVDKNTKLNRDQLIAEIPKYDGLIVRSATKVTAEVIKAGKNLRIIGRAGTGVDNIDCPAATKQGIIVMNTPGGNTLSAAEHTCTLLLSMTRHVANGTQSLREGRWDRKKFMGNEVYGKTLAIIGLGRIGREVGTRMQAFGMRVIGYDPIIPAEAAAEWDCEWLPLEEIWPQADYITVHTPLIPQTKNLLNDEVFAKCKKGVRVINCARGGIIDEEALLRALNSSQCEAAGLDVFLQEPPNDLALVAHPGVTSTPHLGASTVEAQSRVAEDIAKQFVDVVRGKSLFGAINAPALTNALSAETAPWVALGTALGSLGVAITGQVDGQTQVQLITQGDSLKQGGSYLSAAALVGLLRTGSQNGLNLVSAPAIAKEIGIKVSTKHVAESSSGHDVRVTLEIQQPTGVVHRVSGTVAGGRPLLVDIDGEMFPQGTVLEGDVLVYRSQGNGSGLATVAGALSAANVMVTLFASSTPSDGETWNFMRVLPAVQNLDIVQQHVKFIKQISF